MRKESIPQPPLGLPREPEQDLVVVEREPVRGDEQAAGGTVPERVVHPPEGHPQPLRFAPGEQHIQTDAGKHGHARNQRQLDVTYAHLVDCDPERDIATMLILMGFLKFGGALGDAAFEVEVEDLGAFPEHAGDDG